MFEYGGDRASRLDHDEPSTGAARERRLRILHVFRAPLGGLFRHVLDVARGQIERGHDVGFFCDSTTGGERAERMFRELEPHLSLGITLLPIRRNPNLSDLTIKSTLARLCAHHQPDVLHGHGSKGGLYARLVDGGPAAPIRAYTPHGGSFNYQPGSLMHGIYMQAEAMLARRTDVLLFESEYIAGRFRQFIGPTKTLCKVVLNGLAEGDCVPCPPPAEPEFDLLYVGELREAKGIKTLLDSLVAMRAAGAPPATLLLVGSGPQKDELEAYAASLGLADVTTFSPPRPIREVLGRAKAMIVPSWAESLPYVVLEAAAAEQPLVATHVGGIPEIFGATADVLVPPADVGRLTAAIRHKLAQSDAERTAEALSLAQRVRERFSVSAMVDGIMDGYEAAFAARNARKPASRSAVRAIHGTIARPAA